MALNKINVTYFTPAPAKELNDALHTALIEVARERDDLRLALKMTAKDLRRLAARLLEPIPGRRQ